MRYTWFFSRTPLPETTEPIEAENGRAVFQEGSPEALPRRGTGISRRRHPRRYQNPADGTEPSSGRQPMRIVCLGGGPAGLYLSILLKKANPSWDVTVIERNRPTDTFGWGIVFSDKTMDGFRTIDEETHTEITHAFRHWDDIDVFFKGNKITSGGHGFCGIARIKLLQILQGRAQGLGVKLVFQTEVADPDEYASQYDLVIA